MAKQASMRQRSATRPRRRRFKSGAPGACAALPQAQVVADSPCTPKSVLLIVLKQPLLSASRHAYTYSCMQLTVACESASYISTLKDAEKRKTLKNDDPGNNTTRRRGAQQACQSVQKYVSVHCGISAYHPPFLAYDLLNIFSS
jgi:hypothetical protein